MPCGLDYAEELLSFLVVASTSSTQSGLLKTILLSNLDLLLTFPKLVSSSPQFILIVFVLSACH